jgi:uncharacterized caspase-like protein
MWDTSLAEAKVQQFIHNVQASRMVMILDACYSDGAYRNVAGFLPDGAKSFGEATYALSVNKLGAKSLIVETQPQTAISQNKQWGKILIGASSDTEKSWESDILRQGIFTYFMLEGLRKYHGSVKDAFNYAQPLTTLRVREEKEGNTQRPNANVMPRNANWNFKL